MTDVLTERLLGRNEVLKFTGLSYPTIWGKMRAGTFPRSLLLGKTRVAWKASEIQAWLDQLPRRRLKGDPAPVLEVVEGGRKK